MFGKKILFSILMLTIVALVSLPCTFAEEKGTDANDSRVIAKVGENEIVFGDLNNLIRMMPPSYQAMFNNMDQMKQLLERQIDNMLFSQEARRLNLDKDPMVKYKIAEFTKGILTQALIDEKVNKSVVVTDEEIEKYYKGHPDEFKVPEKVKVSHILIAVSKDASEKEKGEKKAQAEEILARIKGGEDFTSLAKQFSDDGKTKKRGGVMGFFTKGSKDPEFEEVAFSLKKGEVSGVVLTKDGYHIIKLLDRKPGKIKTLEEAKTRIRNKLQQKKRNEAVEKLLADLKAKNKVVIYEDVLAEIMEDKKPASNK